ncbi:MAG: SAM-dependent methyltransferase [Betaproteobacteria bacterium]|nr:SAM-dependent methyltransferase [Betaproteobacteria bacterium]
MTVPPARVGRLLLLPVPLGDGAPGTVLPAATLHALTTLTHFVAESARSARRFLAKLPLETTLQSLDIQELNEHTPRDAYDRLLAPVRDGHDLGLVSEAGCPVVADPGAGLVALAHRTGIRVVPMVGPSAPLLAVMASGLGGQSFRFLGYLPADETQRTSAIRRIERDARDSGCTQVFIETPYRNTAMWESLVKTCDESTLLVVAVDLTLETEEIFAKSVGAWRRDGPVALHRRPAVFILGAEPAPTARRLPRHSSP